MTTSAVDIQSLAINTIRTLSMDGVQKANSGHPGTPMALAPVSYVIWNEFLRYDPANPLWPARDRFILSCGHASMLLYSLLHLNSVQGVDDQGNATGQLSIKLSDLQRFRQLHSPCAGHPEHGAAAGIETTTGPLGQGIGNSVGMAVAANWLAERYNRSGLEIFGNDIYALCSDGDLMEGVGNEAASLAGHLGLANLCWVYDDNHITIEGDTSLAFSENVPQRFAALGWHVVEVADANDLDAIRGALKSFKLTTDRPTLVVLRSVIAWGAPNKANTHGAHGAPLGEEEIRLTKQFYGWPDDEHFRVPAEVVEHFAENSGVRGAEAFVRWSDTWSRYQKEEPAAASEVKAILERKLPDGWDASIPSFSAEDKMATRVSSGKVLNAVAKSIPWLIGGSADLAPSTNTNLQFDNAGDFGLGHSGGRNFHFGIREHGMAAMANGMALTGVRPFVATFFVFTDYLRPSMRLAAMMRQPVLYIFTHDSIGLGEDGPTHQPIEHLAACRAIPGLTLIRPCDANEVAEAYRVALKRNQGPTALVLSRQGLPTLCRDKYASASGLARGAYVLADVGKGDPQVILMGSGSEISLCTAAADQLAEKRLPTRVVSVPSMELFEEQDDAYKQSVLPDSIQSRVAVEAGVKMGWEPYVGPTGRFVGMTGYGASAPYADVYTHFGITVENIMATAQCITS